MVATRLRASLFEISTIVVVAMMLAVCAAALVIQRSEDPDNTQVRTVENRSSNESLSEQPNKEKSKTCVCKAIKYISIGSFLTGGGYILGNIFPWKTMDVSTIPPITVAIPTLATSEPPESNVWIYLLVLLVLVACIATVVLYNIRGSNSESDNKSEDNSEMDKNSHTANSKTTAKSDATSDTSKTGSTSSSTALLQGTPGLVAKRVDRPNSKLTKSSSPVSGDKNRISRGSSPCGNASNIATSNSKSKSFGFTPCLSSTGSGLRVPPPTARSPIDPKERSASKSTSSNASATLSNQF